MQRFHIVLVTTPNLKTSRRLAKLALNARLAACVNLVPRVESHYRWKGKVESASEILLVIKTTSTRLEALERLILAEHPYDTPEFLVLPISRGNATYLEWIQSSCKQEFQTASLVK